MKTFKSIFLIGLASLFAASGFLAYEYDHWLNSEKQPLVYDKRLFFGKPNAIPQKTLEERVAEARERSQNRKGVYMTAAVANDRGAAGTRLRNNIIDLIRATELNAIVINVKEASGLEIGENTKSFVEELKKEDIWTIARFTVMRDDSQVTKHPGWYLRRKNTGAVWRDNHKHAWLDPIHPEARNYNIGLAKRTIDLGFDEIQFDYVRFASDGDIGNAAYPTYNSKTDGPKYEAMEKFFRYLRDELKTYKPEIILSADAFGYIATSGNDFGIGQRLEDMRDNFDYISLMVYPSHYYSGFYMAANPERKLPEIHYPYYTANIINAVSNKPYDVVYRSIVFAEDFLAGKLSAATTTPEAKIPTAEKAKFRPFLQAFNLYADTKRGIRYDAAKVRLQIQAAEDAGASGWLLWNPANVYPADALRKDGENYSR